MSFYKFLSCFSYRIITTFSPVSLMRLNPLNIGPASPNRSGCPCSSSRVL
nr:MAG TPA: hypothetical protein [Bacteriophage sp.]